MQTLAVSQRKVNCQFCSRAIFLTLSKLELLNRLKMTFPNSFPSQHSYRQLKLIDIIITGIYSSSPNPTYLQQMQQHHVGYVGGQPVPGLQAPQHHQQQAGATKRSTWMRVTTESRNLLWPLLILGAHINQEIRSKKILVCYSPLDFFFSFLSFIGSPSTPPYLMMGFKTFFSISCSLTSVSLTSN